MNAAQKPSVVQGTVLGERYVLQRPLASGGMAEIFLARQRPGLKRAPTGFDKDVVIKLLKHRYRDDERVTAMFLEEARIGAVLNHPNIVHVYDVGEHEGTPYIAMELIHGEELSQLCRHGLEIARFLPLEHAVDLVRQTAEGMGYFHHKRTEDGAPLDIVHRDISPSNLLITNDGVLKIIDFGIARARTRTSRADLDSLVPGKYNYMSPEQVRGERVDHRSDVYSLGIVLYEITVGKRLFKGRPEEVMDRIAKGRIKPPTFVRKDFPAALEHVVLRALELHPEDRYQSAYELANDLEEFLHDAKLKSGPVRIAQYLDELRAASGGQRRPELMLMGEAWVDDDGEDVLDFDRAFSSAMKATRPARAASPTAAMAWDDDATTSENEKVEPETPSPPPTPAATTTTTTTSPAANANANANAAPAPQPASPHPAPRAPSSALIWIILAVVAVVAGVVVFLMTR